MSFTKKAILASTLEDVIKAMAEGFAFPAIAVPFGADGYTPSRFFNSSGEISEKILQELIENSHPMIDKVRRVHFINLPKTGNGAVKLTQIFHLIQT